MFDGDDLQLSKESLNVGMHYIFGKVVVEIGSIMKSCRTHSDWIQGKFSWANVLPKVPSPQEFTLLEKTTNEVFSKKEEFWVSWKESSRKNRKVETTRLPRIS